MVRILSPRHAFLLEFVEVISTWSKEGYQIIVAGELNEHINSKKVESYFVKIGLREIISEKHRKKGPATKTTTTTTRNRNIKAVERIWGTIGISIDKCVYLPYHLVIMSDYCLIWFKIPTSVALRSNIFLSKSPVAIKLRLHRPKEKKK